MTDEIIIDLEHAAILANEVFDGNEEALIAWFQKPNPYFFNESPLNYILMGNGSAVIELFHEKLGVA